MIRINVAQEGFRVINFTNKHGKADRFFVQTGYAFTVDQQGNVPPYPEKIELPLEKDANGNPRVYPVGDYQLHPSSVYVDRNGRLAVGVRLAPIKVKSVAAA